MGKFRNAAKSQSLDFKLMKIIVNKLLKKVNKIGCVETLHL